MADFSLNLNSASAFYGDFLIIDGDLVLTSDADARGTNNILQDVVQNLRSYQGEWFLDLSFGTPWYQEILAKGARQADIDNAIQAVILNTPGIAVLTKYSSTFDRIRRLVRISFQALTATGVVDYTFTAGASNQ